MENTCHSCGPRKEYRNFLTRKEKVELLRDYKESLEKEVQGISEKIKELEKS